MGKKKKNVPEGHIDQISSFYTNQYISFFHSTISITHGKRERDIPYGQQSIQVRN